MTMRRAVPRPLSAAVALLARRSLTTRCRHAASPRQQRQPTNCGSSGERPSIWSRSTAITLKRYISSSCARHGRASETIADAQWHGQLVTSSAPSQTTSEELVAAIQPLPSSSTAPRTPSAVILVTKQFARVLAQDDAFVGAILSKLWSGNSALQSSKQHRIEASVLAAVVDRIPSVTASDQSSSLASSECGEEGLAICASNTHQLVDPEFDVTQAGPELHTRALKLDEQPPTISVQLPVGGASQEGLLEVVLPIASTLFHTNTPSVVQLSRWTLSSGSAVQVAAGTKKSGNYGIKLPVASTDSTITSTLPLVQVTGPRRIKSVMGNVIRELEEAPRSLDPARFGEIIGQEGGGSTSASRELEEAVAALITMPGKFVEPVAVWALVVPDELASSKAFAALTRSTEMALETIKSQDYAVDSPAGLHDLILSGATLRRVLGGGGGWGNKAGLLSLDPHADYLQRSADDQFDLDGSDPMSFLRGTASPGDRIVFFAAAEVGTSAGSSQPALEFGVVPSTMDDIPVGGDQAVSSHSSLGKSVGRFGFLSELGLSIARRSASGAIPVKSRVDVPLSRILVKSPV